MLVRIAALVATIVLGISSAALGDPTPAAGQQANDPIAKALVPPEIVMAHQQELGLSDAQRSAIQADMEAAQSKFTAAQWQLSAAVEKLVSILAQPHVDEAQALAVLDQELSIERTVKHTQLQLMIEIKNELTPQQQAKVQQLRQPGGQ